jgi:hypothetical protein
VSCEHAEDASLLDRCFGRCVSRGSERDADLEYFVRCEGTGFHIERSGQEPLRASDTAQLLSVFESELAVELQTLRRDLFFLHAGAVATLSGAFLLVGDSGAGKSTLTWALVSRGFDYLSDELAPVSPETLLVHPYPRAISLKVRPPRPLTLPEQTIETSAGFRVPLSAADAEVSRAPRPIRTLFFLDPHAVSGGAPTVRPIGSAEAAARLLSNALNPGAHLGEGLDTALSIARAVPGFLLHRTDVETACDLVGEALQSEPDAPSANPRGD